MNEYENWYCEFKDDEVGNPQIWFGVDLDPHLYQDGYEKLIELAMIVAMVLNERLLDE